MALKSMKGILFDLYRVFSYIKQISAGMNVRKDLRRLFMKLLLVEVVA
jgi:hypothetical protein